MFKTDDDTLNSTTRFVLSDRYTARQAVGECGCDENFVAGRGVS
jgi:hypothetical protein